jgi:hypothetical protein
MMESGSFVGGIIGGVLGLLATTGAAWLTWAVYEDREFDVPYFTVIYAVSLFVTAILMFAGAVAPHVAGGQPRPRIFLGAVVAGIGAFASGSAFVFIGISSSGPPTFFLLFVLAPCAVLLGIAAAATWSSRSERPQG